MPAWLAARVANVEAHEARLTSAARKRFWRYKGKRVARGWSSVAPTMPTRRRRALLRRSVNAWVAMMETEAAGVERLLKARLRRQFHRRRGVAFSRWRAAAETTREKHRVALKHREAHVR